MSGEGMIIIVVAFLILGIVIAAKSAHTDELIREGKAIKRETEFYKNEEFFTAAIPANTAIEKISQVNVNGVKASAGRLRSGHIGVGFGFKGYWTATFAYLGAKDEKALYRFAFTGWKTRNGGVYGYSEMNMLITAVEKALVAIDPDAVVETHRMKVKSKMSIV